MSRPIHFEIQADDLERAKRFYAERLRLDLRRLVSGDRLALLGRAHR